MDEADQNKLPQKKFIIPVLLPVMILTGMVYTLPGPFYPAEAEKKGLTQVQYGVILGTYDLGLLLFSIPVGNFIGKVGPRVVLFSGLLLLGSTTAMFGCLTFIQDGVTFLAISFVIRLFESFGQLFIQSPILCIIQTLFPDMANTGVGWTETAFGFGMFIGPSVSGLLFEAGGFWLPFVVVGLIFFLLFLPTILLIPKNEDKNTEEETPKNYINFFKIPKMWIGVLFNALSLLCNFGFLQSTLEPYLRTFHLSPSEIGAVFFLHGFGYSISAPFWGWLCDKGKSSLFLLIIGGLISAVGLALLGPIPGISEEPKLYLTIPGTFLAGIGMAGNSIPTLPQMLNSCWEKKVPDTLFTKSVINSLWLGSFSLGGVLGPPMGGFLSSYFNFRIATLISAIVYSASAIVVIPIAVQETLSKRQQKDFVRQTKKETD